MRRLAAGNRGWIPSSRDKGGKPAARVDVEWHVAWQAAERVLRKSKPPDSVRRRGLVCRFVLYAEAARRLISQAVSPARPVI